MAGFSSVSAAPVVTIQSLELKNTDQKWIDVIHPDKAVDLTQQEPGVTFINNGRIPPGRYLNFRVVFDEASEEGRSRVLFTAKSDLNEHLDVKKTSFVGVRFRLNPENPRDVYQAKITVDASSQTLTGDQLVLENLS